MTQDIDIRPAVPDDLPRLMAFDHSSTSEHVWQLDLRREPRDQQVSATFREVRLPRPVNLVYPYDPRALADDWEHKAVALVATSGIQPIGYVAVSEHRSSGAWISDLVVVPRWRRRGVGRALLSEAQRWTAEKGQRRLFLEMQSKNYPAIRLALQMGYEFCGYNDHYYSSQDIALFFVRAL